MSDKDAIALLISGAALVVSIGTGVFVYIQVRGYLKQLRFDALSRVLEINRTLLSLGFQNGALFDVLEGRSIPNVQIEKRYLQMWLNQIHLLWLAHREDLIDADHWEGHSRDFVSFVSLPNFKAHWQHTREFYSPDFGSFVDGLISGGPLSAQEPATNKRK